MPKQDWENENLEQEWEPVVWTKTIDHVHHSTNDVDARNQQSIGFKIKNGRRNVQMTQLQLCQAMGIKLKLLESYEANIMIPPANHLVKLNRIIRTRI